MRLVQWKAVTSTTHFSICIRWEGAFRPEPDVRAVRTLMRNRSDLVEMASQHVQHMQKALKQMNVQFQHVISDITGLTGLAILDAIVNGERDPAELAKLRDPHVKASEDPLRTLFPDSGSVRTMTSVEARCFGGAIGA